MVIDKKSKGIIASPQVPNSAHIKMVDAMSQFEFRFQRLKEGVGVKTDIDLAKVLGISQSSVASARERKSIPSRWIIEISDKHGVSSDWLLHGEGPKYRNQARHISSQPTPPVVSLDLDFIRELVVILEEALEEQKLRLPPKRKAELMALLYEEFAEGDERKEISKGKILRFARALTV